MNALTTGALIFLYLLLANAIAAYIQQETVPTTVFNSCTTNDNITVCQDIGETSFVSTLLDVSVSGINDADPVFNGFWILINSLLLVLAGVLVVGWFVGLFFGGAS